MKKNIKITTLAVVSVLIFGSAQAQVDSTRTDSAQVDTTVVTPDTTMPPGTDMPRPDSATNPAPPMVFFELLKRQVPVIADQSSFNQIYIERKRKESNLV